MNIMQKLILFTKDILAESCYMLLVANMNIEHSVTSFPWRSQWPKSLYISPVVSYISKYLSTIHLGRPHFFEGRGVPIADICQLKGGRGIRNEDVCNFWNYSIHELETAKPAQTSPNLRVYLQQDFIRTILAVTLSKTDAPPLLLGFFEW